MQKRAIILISILLSVLAVLVMAIPSPDEDGDGYCPYAGTYCPSGLDCNDNNPDVNPGVDELPGDDIDNDCNGIIDDACTDADNDGYSIEAKTGGVDCGGAANIDCDDTNIYINPGVDEVCDDGIDNDCDGDIDEDDSACGASECTIYEDMSFWINCDAEEINSANEGDSVYMLLWAEGCDEDVDNVEFKIYEHSTGHDSLEDTVDAVEILTDVDDDAGNPTDVDIWFAPWVASYIEDDDDTDPEFYFTARLTQDGSYYEASSGKTDDTLLSVTGCDGCGIECLLDIGGMTGTGGGGMTLLTPPCEAEIDCTPAQWSACNPSTGKMTRDVELCDVSGTGSVECMENVKLRMAAEKLCSSSSNPSSKSSAGPDIPECGDDICEEDEDCEEDCGTEDGFPWLWLLLAIILIGGVASGIIYAYQKKKGAVKKPEAKKMPFNQQKDLDSVLGYVKTAKAKGYDDSQVADALKKAGWKDDQVKFAFGKINKPAEAAKQASQNPVKQ
ncbi:MAG: putative metal-binding motif-containing protein [Nanoarchaeota archaeon]|nr:putative metal-binding motif-containing protein [Nanoarchaeota archaeon]